MRLVFSGFEHVLEVLPSCALVLEINNPVLFARVCQSLNGNEGVLAIEPYTLWEGEEKLATKSAFLTIFDPFNLPWDRRSFTTEVAKQVELELYEDDTIRILMEQLHAELTTKVLSASLSMHADYGFLSDWDLKKYMKTFSFSVDYNEGNSLFDNLIGFVRYARDAGFKDVLVFANLHNFLSKNEYQEVLSSVVFHEIKAIFLENYVECEKFENASHYVLDRDFVGCFK